MYSCKIQLFSALIYPNAKAENRKYKVVASQNVTPNDLRELEHIAIIGDLDVPSDMAIFYIQGNSDMFCSDEFAIQWMALAADRCFVSVMFILFQFCTRI
jgi:hypothetical protein